VVTLWVRKLG